MPKDFEHAGLPGINFVYPNSCSLILHFDLTVEHDGVLLHCKDFQTWNMGSAADPAIPRNAIENRLHL